MNRLTPIIALFFLCSCEITELEEPNTPNQQEEGNGQIDNTGIDATDSANFVTLITGDSSKTWTASGFTLAGFEGFLDCRLDDAMTLKADGTYTFDGGSDLCGAEDNQRFRNGTWELYSFDNMELIFDKGTSNEYVADVIGLKEGEISLVGSYMGLEVRGRYENQ